MATASKDDKGQPLTGELIKPDSDAGTGFWAKHFEENPHLLTPSPGNLAQPVTNVLSGGVFGVLGMAQQNQAELAHANDVRQSNLDLTREGVTHKLIDKAESAEERKHYADHYYTNDRAAIEQAGKDRVVDAKAQTSMGWAGVVGGFFGLLAAGLTVMSKNKD